MVVWYIKAVRRFETFITGIEEFEAFQLTATESAWFVPGTITE